MPPPFDIDRMYRENGHVVLRRARRILQDEDDAREVLQEVFASLVERPQQYSGTSSITTWLYAATTHRCLNRIRATKTRSRLLDEAVAPHTRSSEAPRAVTAAEVADLLERIPEKLAKVAVYRYLDGMTGDEIASVMGCSRRQVGKLIARLHARLGKLHPLVPQEERRDDRQTTG